MSVAVFLGAYALIASERIHRMAAALGGAGIMLAIHATDTGAAFFSERSGVDWNVIFLLLGMMVIVGVLKQTGVFEYLAIWAAKRARGRPYRLMVLLVIITALASAFLDNVTTVLLIAPVTFLVCQRLALPVVPYLIAEAMASNIGGTATLVGDPPNIIIASRGGLSLALEIDRKFGTHVYDAETGGAMLWQHLFWFFGHPEVYIIAVPFFGIISEVIPVFSRKPIFGYIGLVAATVSIAGLSMTVWAHHMFVTGQVLLPFFSMTSFLIAVPTGVKFFNWVGTMWRGHLSFESPMLFCIGFLVTFLIGGLTGVILASPPLDFHVSDTYFVVAHIHYVVFGTVVFAMFAGFYFWWPKMTGKMLNDGLGKLHFRPLFIGFEATFLVQFWLGAVGFPRRYADYSRADGFTELNMVSSAGAFLLGASTLVFLFNIWRTSRVAPKVMVDDPWGFGNSLEWATSCPPPRHNFSSLPRIRSERPAFDMRYPHRQPG